jgi:hypothetical protein
VSCADLLCSVWFGKTAQAQCSLCCVLTEYEPVAGLVMYSLCRNVAMKDSHIHKLSMEQDKGRRKKKERKKGKKKEKLIVTDILK